MITTGIKNSKTLLYCYLATVINTINTIIIRGILRPLFIGEGEYENVLKIKL